jgi:hypothetical protein
MTDKARDNQTVKTKPPATSKQPRQHGTHAESVQTTEQAPPDQLIEQVQHGAHTLDSHQVSHLQRVVGNRAVNQLLPTHPTTGPHIQRRIVIGPEDFLSGLGVTTDKATNAQVNEYINVAVLDEVKFAIKIATDEKDTTTVQDFTTRVNALKGKKPDERVELLKALITRVNQYVDEHYQVWEKSYTAEGADATSPISNRRTRYATTPEGGYSHTSLTTGKAEGVKWGSDREMWSQFAQGVGANVTASKYGATSPGTSGLVSLQQLPWAEAKRLFPRPLINLIFDVRYQLETYRSETEEATVIDERTPHQKARKDKSPNEPGTLRSWHQDSVGVLPSSGFDAEKVPAQASSLHQHYKNNSQVGAGSSIGSGISGPQGLAEYTGTGSDWEHNTKVVLDYINKRVYLTLTHYQYWALVKRDDKYEFWESGTQVLSEAQGRLATEQKTGGKLAGVETKDVILMSPWMEILMPTKESLAPKKE